MGVGAVAMAVPACGGAAGARVAMGARATAGLGSGGSVSPCKIPHPCVVKSHALLLLVVAEEKKEGLYFMKKKMERLNVDENVDEVIWMRGALLKGHLQRVCTPSSYIS